MNNFDEEFMVKELPKIPEEYQPDKRYRDLGIISPTRRMIYWNPEFEFDALRYLCYRRVITRSKWACLYREVRLRRQIGGNK